MSDIEKVLFLDNPIHKNSFPEDLMTNEEVLDSLLITFDGTIMGVDFDIIEPYFSSEESSLIRIGMKKYPDRFKIDSQESLYKYLSFQKSSF
tara:strand:- start:6710 stop:6985 length:276 start_codon:yes stop_codon:yes gene_type:complete